MSNCNYPPSASTRHHSSETSCRHRSCATFVNHILRRKIAAGALRDCLLKLTRSHATHTAIPRLNQSHCSNSNAVDITTKIDVISRRCFCLPIVADHAVYFPEQSGVAIDIANGVYTSIVRNARGRRHRLSGRLRLFAETLPRLATASVVDVVGKRRDDTSVEFKADIFQQETDGPIKWIPFVEPQRQQRQINSS